MPTTGIKTRGWTKARSELAVAVRCGGTPDEIAAHRQNFKFEKLADHVQSAIDSVPPLTPEQRAHIAALLAGDN